MISFPFRAFVRLTSVSVCPDEDAEEVGLVDSSWSPHLFTVDSSRREFVRDTANWKIARGAP